MKRSAVTLVALSLFASAATFAAANPYKAREAHQKPQPALAAGRHDRGNDHRGNDRGGNDQRNDHRNDRGHDRRDHGNDRHDNDRRDHDRRAWDNRHHDSDRRDRNRQAYPGDNHGWDRYRNDWSSHPNYWDNRRHDRRDYAQYRYHFGSYHRPSGYYYRAWHRGDRLPRSWYGASYIVHDWRPYRLYSPPYGYHWVRVGDDVLLTAIATGVVLDVIYDIWY